MPEGLTVEVAHKISEHRPHESTREQFLEIVEALMLSVVAVATAWCGYQASKWEGRQAYLYSTSVEQRVEAANLASEGTQQRLLDMATFNTWIQLREDKNDPVARRYERHLSKDFKVAFDAWLKTDPFSNEDAPAGPAHMAEYRNSLLDQSAQLHRKSTETLAQGTQARTIAEVYVRRSVMLATVLFLTALAQRFKIRKVRIALLLVAGTLLAYQLVDLGMHPRL
jgi:hypothetical protein